MLTMSAERLACARTSGSRRVFVVPREVEPLADKRAHGNTVDVELSRGEIDFDGLVNGVRQAGRPSAA